MPREAELSETYRVSRQAVREALKVLAAKGLVVTRRRTGSLVASRALWNLLDPDVIAWHGHVGVNADFLCDLVAFRLLLEPKAAALAAEHATAGQIEQIREAIEEMRRNVDDRTAFAEADARFHVAVFAASGNSLIDRLSTIIAPLLEIGATVPSSVEANPAWAAGRHDRVLMAIAGRDAEVAQATMSEVLAVYLAGNDSRRPADAKAGDSGDDDTSEIPSLGQREPSAVGGLYPSQPLHGRVAHAIGARIVSGVFREGSTLPREAEFAAEYKVSRQAVREALKVLAAKGLVSTRRRAGTSVASRADWNLLDPDVVAWHQPQDLPRDFLRELGELRRVVEPAAAAIAAERRNAAQMERISEAIAAMRRASTPAGWAIADVEFHMAVAAATGNMLIGSFGRTLAPLLEASIRERSEVASAAILAINRHAVIAEAIRRRDHEAARKAMVAMLDLADRQFSQSAAGGLRQPA